MAKTKKDYASRKKVHGKTEANSFGDMCQCQTCQVNFAVKLTVLTRISRSHGKT